MHIPVLIEPVAGYGYRARSLIPDAVTAEGRTDAEALKNLRERIQSQLAAGARIAYLDLAVEEHPLARSAGILQRDDPLVQEWKDIMAENRRKDDENPDAL
jgi:hypothetical protein